MSVQKKRKVINLFNDRSIHGYKVVFNINNENDLSDFWSYFVDMQTTFSNEAENLHGIIELIFKHASLTLETYEDISFDIIVE